MNRPHLRPASRGPFASAAAAGLLTLLLAVSACAQNEGGADAGAALTAEQADSLYARAERSRTKGADTARVTVFEISDFQCPFCGQFAAETYPKLDSAYVRTGKVRFVFIHYPLPNHRQAFTASEAALCAGAQDAFWPMHDRLFATQREWSNQPDAAARFAGFAEELGLDMEAYRACTGGDQVSGMILNDVMNASGAGISGTPTFIVGREVIGGAAPFEQLAQAIDRQIAAVDSAAAAGAGAPPAPPR